MRARPAKPLVALAVAAGFSACVRPPSAGPPPGPPAPGHVRVAGIVLKWVRGDAEANLARAEPLIREAAAHGAQVVCTTESFLDGYVVADARVTAERLRAHALPIPGSPELERLAGLAGELGVYLVAGVLELDGSSTFNSAVVLGPDGGLVGKYRKQVLGFESPRNTPGRESPVFATPFGDLGVMICADRREPRIANELAEAGADFIVVPSGGLFGPAENDPLVQARSRAAGLPIVFVHPSEFLATSADGTIIARAIRGGELTLEAGELGGPRDCQGVFYVDLPIGRASGLAAAGVERP